MKSNICTTCPHSASKGPISYTGRLDANILLLKERPQDKEDKILSMALRSSGLSFNDVTLSYATQCFSTSFDTKAATLCTENFSLLPLLEGKKVIMLLGENVTKMFSSYKTGHRSLRGYIVGYLNGIPLVASDATNEAFRKHGTIRILIADMMKVKRIACGEPILPLPVVKSLEHILNRAYKEGYVCLDIETSKDHFMTSSLESIGLGFADEVSFNPAPFNEEDISLIEDLFCSDVTVLGQNIGFDFSVLCSLGFTLPKNLEDTLQLHHSVFSSLPHRLEFLGSIYLNVTPWKFLRQKTEVK